MINLNLDAKAVELNTSITQISQQIQALSVMLHKNMGALDILNHLIEAQKKELSESEDLGDVNIPSVV